MAIKYRYPVVSHIATKDGTVIRALLGDAPISRVVGWQQTRGSGSMPGTRYQPRERAEEHRTEGIMRNNAHMMKDMLLTREQVES